MILHNNSNHHTKNMSEKPWGTIKNYINDRDYTSYQKETKQTPIGAGGDKQNFMAKRCTK